jgi:hypothetical protein
MGYPEIEARRNLRERRFVARFGLVNGGESETVQSHRRSRWKGKRASTTFDLVGRLKPRQTKAI